MHLRPNRLPHERGNPMGDSRKWWGGARAVDERAIEIDAVVERAVARSSSERGGIQHGNQDDTSKYVLDANFAYQAFKDHGAFVFIAVIRAERDQAFACARLGPDEHGERNQ